MTFNLVTAFPDIYNSFVNTSLIKKALDRNLIDINIIDLKEFGIGKYKKIDDKPYGGGEGMVIRPDVVFNTFESISNKGLTVALTPKGEKYNQKMATDLSKEKIITLLCGRYEGFDERVYELVDKKISVGDYITMGGEIPSMIIIETISRLIPGILGNSESTKNESHTGDIETEYPIYTKPLEFNGNKVPEVLLSGNHKEIQKWREENTVFNKK